MEILDNEHYTNRDYRQRITSRQWQLVLLASQDTMIFKGTIVQLVAKNLGFGVVEVYKEFKVPEMTEENKT